MARLSTYGIDAKPELQDKVIGTDTSPGANLRTKNYSLQEIVDLFNQGNSLGVADQTIYKFQSDISEGRETGTISFIAGGGVGNPFAATTTLLISKTAAGGGNIANFLALFNGKDIILAETKNINNFGRYNFKGFVDRLPFEPKTVIENKSFSTARDQLASRWIVSEPSHLKNDTVVSSRFFVC